MGDAGQVIALLAALALHAAPPKQLACLARHYPLTPVLEDGGWSGKLPDGTLIPWDDGRTKSVEEKYAQPDLHDTLSEPYPRGPMGPITDVDADPGRMRVDALFFATYGASAEAVRKQLVPFTFFGQILRVHPRVLQQLERVKARLEALVAREPQLGVYLQHVGGTFNWRVIAGTDRLSAHSFGVSIDLNVARAAYWQWAKPVEPVKWRNELPQSIVDAFEAEGFIWGGRWYHYDTMHFEYRPELLDPECRL